MTHLRNYIISIVLAALTYGCSTSTTGATTDDDDSPSTSINTAILYEAVKESQSYTTHDSVAAYICKFDKLPRNYVGKDKGKKLYENSTGNTFGKWNFNPWETLGVMIGGDTFENRDGLLPEGTYREADVDYGKIQSRGTKRLVYQTGCIIYYTANHYESFTQLKF
ncbi:MAG: hypothetical protein MJY98_03460 [Fibrobacter sp.]|nr:hypothetical protein [Fibrobacter sp.]